jgi:limonene-1,2-epoxide hydrolase
MQVGNHWWGGNAMGAGEEKLVLKFMEHADGREQDMDAMAALMADDIVWQINVPMWKPRVGREVARAAIASQNAVSTSGLRGSEVLHLASNDGGVVFAERIGVFQVGDKRITLRINAVYEVVDGKIAAWREYYDSVDLARQLGIDPNLAVEQ